MPFVIRRLDQGGGYVAPAGSAKSYTYNPLKARRFETQAQAEADSCGNERVIPIERIL